MKRAGLVFTAMAALAVFALPASAATYLFKFQSDPSDATYGDVLIKGQFTTAGSGFGPINAISGNVSGGNSAFIVDGLIGGTSPYADADNVLYDTGTFGNYSFGGVSFTVDDGVRTAAYNLFDWQGSTYLISSLYDSVGYDTSGVVAGGSPIPNIVSAVPEPGIWAMLLLGFGGIGFQLRGSRRRQSTFAAA